MLDITNFGLFIISVFFLSVTPGPDMAYVAGQSVANGRRAGIISATGVALGSCTHTVASAIGLTALIATSPVMFSVIKHAGAGYLIYLGCKLILGTLREKETKSIENIQIEKQISLYSLLLKGFITTLTNPQVLLFFISFFPQFVIPSGENHTLSFIILGFSYAIVTFLTDSTFAIIAGSAAGVASQSRFVQKLMNRVVGVTFIALGIRVALTRR